MPQDHLSDEAFVAEFGRRVALHRRARNLTQAEFAERSGVARSTVQRIERGESIQLSSLVKLLRVLGRLDTFDAVLAAEVRSPVAELQRQRAQRQRVRHGDDEAGMRADAQWSWGEEG